MWEKILSLTKLVVFFGLSGLLLSLSGSVHSLFLRMNQTIDLNTAKVVATSHCTETNSNEKL